VVVPHKYKPIEKIIVLYDGQPSSVNAVKMFSYLMSCYKDLPMQVLTIKPPTDTLHLPDNRLMREFMKRHFPYADYLIIKGNPETVIPQHLETEENALVVLGAYQRGMVSRWFKESMADVILKKLYLPVFIAHK
jgi:hypothetical protein